MQNNRRDFLKLSGLTGFSLMSTHLLGNTAVLNNERNELKIEGADNIQVALLTLPEVLPPWEHFDYDVREEYFHGGGSNVTYCIRHLENLCHNLGLSIRRTKIDGLEKFRKAVLLVPDASRMFPETKAALDKWISEGKPVIIFGDIPKEWALKYGIQVVPQIINSNYWTRYDSIYFPSGDLSIPAKTSNYASYISHEPVAILKNSKNASDTCTFACRQGSVLFCGWVPRLHFWEVISELDEHRFFIRLLKEFKIDVSAPDFPKEKISNLKSLGVDNWGLWHWPLSPSSALADYGFAHLLQYGSYFLSIIERKFEEKLVGIPLKVQMQSLSSQDQLDYLQKLISKAHESKLKLYVVIAPFTIYSPCVYNKLLEQDGLQYRNTNGVLDPTSYWSPASKELRLLAIESLREFLAQQKVDGIFIDFARYLDGNFDYGPAMRTAFEKEIGKRIGNWPLEVIDDPHLAQQFSAFKRNIMSDFLSEFGFAAKEMQKDVIVEALFYWNLWPDPGGAYENLGQDPKKLVEMGAIDRACGIFYTSDNTQLETLVDQGIKDVGIDAFSCIIAPMSFFNEYNNTHQVIDQIQVLKKKGVRHASIFSHVPTQLIFNRFENGEHFL